MSNLFEFTVEVYEKMRSSGVEEAFLLEESRRGVERDGCANYLFFLHA